MANALTADSQSSAIYVFSFTAVNIHSFLCGQFAAAYGFVMELECAPSLLGLVRRTPVMRQPVPEEASARFQRYHRIPSNGYICIANLPISAFEMDHRTFVM